MPRNLLVIVFSVFFSLLQAQSGITNPLLPSGADPFSTYKDGFYYYTHTTGKNITIWKTRSMAELATAEKKIVFESAPGKAYSRELWAPEIHFIGGKWYVYFAADSLNNNGHRLWVLENASADPMQGEWTLKGKLTTPGDKWSIDASVFEQNGQMYCIWSGWEGDVNGQQDIYIAKMSNPWTITGKRVRLSAPELDWEIHGDLKTAWDPPHVSVNEGPEILQHGNRIFLVYSASGCWTEYYALGMLSARADADLMDPRSWTKSPQPVFRQSTANKVYAPGHNSFFKSPDGKQDWILYHANSEPGQGCGKFRSPRAQPFTWDASGAPVFGVPAATGALITHTSN